jgi:hypothetical protein
MNRPSFKQWEKHIRQRMYPYFSTVRNDLRICTLYNIPTAIPLKEKTWLKKSLALLTGWKAARTGLFFHKQSAPLPDYSLRVADFIRQCKRYTLYSTYIGPMHIVNSDLKSCSGKARLKTVRHGGRGMGRGRLAYTEPFFKQEKLSTKDDRGLRGRKVQGMD